MKKLIAMVSLLGAGIVHASAADMAARPYTKAPIAAPVMTYNWTGCYVGGNLGGGWAQTQQTQIAKVGGAAIIPNNDFGSSQSSRFIGGGQVGCDYQFASNWVFGLQGMVNLNNYRSSHFVATAFPGFPIGAFTSNNVTRFTTTATGRIGYLVAPQLLTYVKGGAAWTRTDYTIFGNVPAQFLSEFANGVNRQGYTVGGGFEWMFAPGWSVFGEFDYLDFGRRNVIFTAGPGTAGLPDVVRTRVDIVQALAGVNYKFSWSGPVVAKY